VLIHTKVDRLDAPCRAGLDDLCDVAERDVLLATVVDVIEHETVHRRGHPGECESIGIEHRIILL